MGSPLPKTARQVSTCQHTSKSMLRGSGWRKMNVNVCPVRVAILHMHCKGQQTR